MVEFFHSFSIWIWQIIKAHKNYDASKQVYLMEYFSGLKSNTKSRIFCLIFMLQRLVYPLILIVGSNFCCEAKLGTMTVIQFFIFLYLWLWRPYLTIKDLLLEIITQVLSGVWYAILIYYNTESRWNTIVNWTFVALIMGSSLIATIITIIDFIIIVKNKVKERWSKSRTNNYRSKANNASSLTQVQEIQASSSNPSRFQNNETQNSPSFSSNSLSFAHFRMVEENGIRKAVFYSRDSWIKEN